MEILRPQARVEDILRAMHQVVIPVFLVSMALQMFAGSGFRSAGDVLIITAQR